MTVDKALETARTIIANEILATPVDTGATTSHSLSSVDDAQLLFTLDMSLKEVALKAIPISLLETAGSTASELRRVSMDYFIRVPNTPLAGTELDIDDGLAYAVVFKTLGSLGRGLGEQEQKAEAIINTYLEAYRTYLEELVAGVVGAGAETYIRFSADGTNWHSSFSTSDVFISFKRIDTSSWTASARFMGTDGTNGTNFDDTLTYAGNAGKVVAVNATEDGIELVTPSSGGSSGGATAFVGLSDTPTALVAGKFVAVNTAGDALEFVEAPTSSSSGSGGLAGANVFGDKVFFDDNATGTISLDASTHNVFYLYPNADLEIGFTQFDDDGMVPAFWGTTYTFLLISNASTQITFSASESIIGDHSVELGSASTGTAKTTTILKMIYTGYDWYVSSRAVIINSNG